MEAVEPKETHLLPKLLTFSLTAQVFDSRGVSVCMRKMELSVYRGEVKEEEEVLQNLTTFSSST